MMDKPCMEPLCLSISETAKALGVSKPKVYQLVNCDDFPAFRCGGRTLVSAEGLREWVRRQVKDKTPADLSA